MIGRSLFVAAILIGASAEPGHTAPDLAPARTSATTTDASLAAYRAYVQIQADSLVGMTKVLAREIKDGNLDAAQAAYAPAHRYLKRIEPIARILLTLQKRMDAQAEDYAARADDPGFSGFHRIEYGLYANRSVAGLTDAGDRLARDSRELRERLKLLDVEPGLLFDTAVRLTRELAETRLAGDEERYARTDLWDLEANVDGVREVVALLRPQLTAQKKDALTRIDAQFARIDEALAVQKAGCGFKSYDELSAQDKAVLKARVAALADELSSLRTTLAME